MKNRLRETLNGFFVYFSPCFSIITRIKVFCIADLIILIFFDVAARNVNDDVCYDNFINRFVLNNCRQGFFIIIFGITKNRRFGRFIINAFSSYKTL